MPSPRFGKRPASGGGLSQVPFPVRRVLHLRSPAPCKKATKTRGKRGFSLGVFFSGGPKDLGRTLPFCIADVADGQHSWLSQDGRIVATKATRHVRPWHLKSAKAGTAIGVNVRDVLSISVMRRDAIRGKIIHGPSVLKRRYVWDSVGSSVCSGGAVAIWRTRRKVNGFSSLAHDAMPINETDSMEHVRV